MPLLLTTLTHDLDRSDKVFGDDGRRRAPHAAMQEYLNAEPANLWGLVANGNCLRLLRDNPSLTRPAYVEADLERIFEESLYSDFAALFLLAHAGRVAPGAGGMMDCWLERWRAEGAKTGQRALERLRVGVTTALRELGSGFVEHTQNDTLRGALRDGTVTADTLHQQLLRLVYRLLFLFTAEERDLLHAPDAAPETRALYVQGYGLGRLRERARRRRYYDMYPDLWTSLTVTFRALSRGALPLGLPALGGLFEEDQCFLLDVAALPNKRLLAAIFALGYFEDQSGLARVNYRDMGTEELGSVYESLLELHPVVQVDTRPWTFAFVGDEVGGAVVKGSERRLSGSYYTPDSLVQELLRSALDPVIERAIKDNQTDPRGALLRLRVLDPACGSGHFLLGAARRLADAVARLDMEGDLPDEAARRRALREVVRRCIFGVDRNPLSVELCKTALWIEAIEPGKPLSFLDAHIKCGDSLIGVADLSVLKSGIPDEAFKDLTGDDKGYCRDLKKRNKGERENPSLSLVPEAAFPSDLAVAIAALTDAPEDTLAAVHDKRRVLRDVTASQAPHDLRVACDLWCAAFFAAKAERPDMRGRDIVPTTDTVWRYIRAPSSVYGPLIGAVEVLRGKLRFFHWPMEFPEVTIAGGFDCVLGNPPWEVLQFSEEEYFSDRKPSIATLTGARRKAAIVALKTTDHSLWHDYRQDLRLMEATNQFIRDCGFYNLTARGKLNTYALFAEAFVRMAGISGQAGLIVPTGIATDDNNKAFFSDIVARCRLASMFAFENEDSVFPHVHHAYRFALLTIGCSEQGANFIFFARRAEHLIDKPRMFRLTTDEVRLLNPNTLTCPVFRSSADAELAKRIYSHVPVLIDESRGCSGNPWKISFRQGLFNMSSDSSIFCTASQLAGAGCTRDGAGWILPDGSIVLPLYEAKMIHHFDHRWATFSGDREDARDSTAGEKSNPAFRAEPRYWVTQQEVARRLIERDSRCAWLMGWRDITGVEKVRTVISAVLPKVGVGHTLPLFFIEQHNNQHQAAFGASLSSLVFDFTARQKVGGTHLTYSYLKQLPALLPDTYNESVLSFLVPRVIELTYTADDMRPWAKDVGYEGAPFIWNEDRRAHIRAELDAAYAHLYGLTRDELRYILDPTDIYGAAFPSETFRVLKEREIRQYGEYRTARLVLAAWDRLTADGTFKGWAQ